MVLNLDGFLDGISALGVLIASITIGTYYLYKDHKLRVMLLRYAGIMIFLLGLLWLGPTADFIVKSITGYNLNPIWMYAILSYIWVPPAVYMGILISGDIILRKQKWLLLLIVLIGGVIFEIGILFFPFQDYSFTYNVPEQGIIDALLNHGFFPFYILVLFLLMIFFFNGVGILRKAIKGSKDLRKRLFFLGAGFMLFVIVVHFDTIMPPGIFLPIVRLLIIVSEIMFYISLRPLS